MIIVNSGGYKTGSTWLSNIISATTPKVSRLEIPSVDRADLDPSIVCPQKHREILASVLAYREVSSSKLLLKIHCYGRGKSALKALAPHDDLYFVSIERNLRDILVSRYYHELNGGKEFLDFSDFMERSGRGLVFESISIRSFWRRMRNYYPARVHIVSYEQLHADYLTEVSALMAFLNVEDWSEEDALKVRSLSANKKRFQREWMADNFYRKGIVGDSKNHFRTQDEFRLRAHVLSAYCRLFFEQ